MKTSAAFPLAIHLSKESYTLIESVYTKCSYTKPISKMTANELKNKTPGQIFIMDLVQFLEKNYQKVKYFKNYMQFVIRLAYKLQLISELSVVHPVFIAQTLPKTTQKLSKIIANSNSYSILISLLSKISKIDGNFEEIIKDIKQSKLDKQKQILQSIVMNLYKKNVSNDKVDEIGELKRKNQQHLRIISQLKQDLQGYKSRVQSLETRLASLKSPVDREDTKIMPISIQPDKIHLLQKQIKQYQKNIMTNQQKLTLIEQKYQLLSQEYQTYKRESTQKLMVYKDEKFQNEIMNLRKNESSLMKNQHILRQGYDNLTKMYEKNKEDYGILKKKMMQIEQHNDLNSYQNKEIMNE